MTGFIQNLWTFLWTWYRNHSHMITGIVANTIPKLQWHDSIQAKNQVVIDCHNKSIELALYIWQEQQSQRTVPIEPFTYFQHSPILTTRFWSGIVLPLTHTKQVTTSSRYKHSQCCHKVSRSSASEGKQTAITGSQKTSTSITTSHIPHTHTHTHTNTHVISWWANNTYPVYSRDAAALFDRAPSPWTSLPLLSWRIF